MSQKKLILNYLLRGKKITQLKALFMFGCLRLSGRIHELRKEGHAIVTGQPKNKKKRYAIYYMEGLNNGK